jgi:hypothetical protein
MGQELPFKDTLYNPSLHYWLTRGWAKMTLQKAQHAFALSPPAIVQCEKS